VDGLSRKMEGYNMKESLTEQDCKLITEKLLGECWHEKGNKAWIDMFGGPPTEECKHCQHKGIENRTFTDPQDFFACFNSLVEKGEWNEFDEWAYMKWDQLKPFNDLSRHLGEHSQWLLSRTESGHFRLCCLVAEWLTAQNGENNP
jgi:hypothetical protein